MAIEKNNFKVSRFDSEISPGSRDSMSSDDDEFQPRSSAVDSDDDDDEEFNDADSGAGSDDFDLLELGETGAEFVQVGNQTCSVPFELYDLPDLREVLSLDVWNECLSEEERFNLAKYLPDSDLGTFMRTLKELFLGSNFHFGSPITKLFDMLKGGLCEPRVALYRQGLSFFQKHQHYHLLRKHQNNIVTNLYQIRDAWINCRGYSIEEKLRVLNIMKSQRSLMYEKMEDMGLESDSSEREESGEGLWSERLMDWKVGQKTARHSVYGASPNLEFPSRGRSMALESANYGKQNPKGILKLAGSKTPSTKELVGRFPSIHHGLEMKPGPYGSTLALPRQNKAAGYDSGAVLRTRDQMRGDNDAEETMYDVAVQRDRNVSRVGVMDKAGVLKLGKKYDHLRGDEFSTDSYMGLPLSLKNDLQAYGRNKNVNQLSDIKVLTAKPSNTRASYSFGKKAKYPENVQQYAVEDQMKSVKGRVPHLPPKGNRDLSDRSEPFWHKKTQGEAFSMDSSFKYDDWNVRSKKWKSGRESPDLKLKSYRASPPQMNDRLFHSEYGAKASKEKIRGNSMQNGGRDMAALKGMRMFAKSEETESDSSEQLDEEEEDANPLMRSKLAYPGGVLEGSRSSFVKSALDLKNTKFVKKDKKESAGDFDGITSSKKMSDLGEHLRMPEVENYSLKAKQKGKMRATGHLHNSATRGLEDNYFSGASALNGDGYRKKTYKLGKNGQLQGEPGERLHMSSSKVYSAERRQKGEVGHDHSVRQAKYGHDYAVEEEDDSLETRVLADDNGLGRLRKKGQSIQAYGNDRHERSEAPLVGCNSVTRKRKGKEDVTYMDGRDEYDYLPSNPQQQMDDSPFLKKQEKMKMEADTGSLDMGTSEPLATETEVTDVELETKPQKKPFTLITPTVHTGFSFSIIHLLSAVRMAMITPHLEDSLEVGKHLEQNDSRQKLIEEQNRKHESINGVHSHENVDINNSEHPGQLNVPSLTVQEIVNRVRSNPGDPCILETQEPLHDLVRGVLKIFSSRTAPLGAKGWKPLVFYEKSTKSWSWIGPVSPSSSDHETIEEVTSPEAWGLPHKMLVKLVDSFANWLKSGQETLQQIGSLPDPPASLMQFNLEEKDRFKDLRAQKSLHTINPSSEEVRAYFRREEVLRYSIPDRAFCYTAADGRKSIVAPLRRCGGKPTSKARDHFMLKRDRPPHVTILCLVRDAAARLPGSIGTRADVCTLIRDSQYIVEDVSDAQVNQVVSGALDRLHYERDPCVQFDSERKLWVYLHREREEEDFEDDGTSSTKKWKRQKKDATEQFDQGAVTVAYHGTGEQLDLICVLISM
ncbi:hypothetical protein L1049_013106 [Liquidambar formosana]|uniref:DEUBAD domain-containing protein n=1 Tax=Liquidambar formosana TaxID=63359 RepID=A0AAP0WU04_LIQFO